MKRTVSDVTTTAPNTNANIHVDGMLKINISRLDLCKWTLTTCVTCTIIFLSVSGVFSHELLHRDRDNTALTLMKRYDRSDDVSFRFDVHSDVGTSDGDVWIS